MAEKQYRAVRRHEGDRMYEEGETRTLAEADARHLVPHVLAPLDDAKAEPPLQNKAEMAPANKAGKKGSK